MFPDRIWDGTSPARKTMGNSSAPNHGDFCAIVGEISTVQKYLLSLAQNLKLMPDLQGVLHEASEKIEALTQKINAITVPADLKVAVEALDMRVDSLDVRVQVADLTQQVEVVTKSVTEVSLMCEKLHMSIREDVQSLRHLLRNELAAVRREHKEHAESVGKEHVRLNRLLNIKAELSRLEQ